MQGGATLTAGSTNQGTLLHEVQATCDFHPSRRATARSANATVAQPAANATHARPAAPNATCGSTRNAERHRGLRRSRKRHGFARRVQRRESCCYATAFTFVPRPSEPNSASTLATWAFATWVSIVLAELAAANEAMAPPESAEAPVSPMLIPMALISVQTLLFFTSGRAGFPTTRSPSPTSRITTAPAPVCAPAPIRTGATSEEFDPTKAPGPISVRCLCLPS